MIKQIEGYPNYYVSDQGEVFRNWHGTFKKLKLYEARNRGGYLIAVLSKGKGRGFTVHRLVAQAFIPNPENKPLVDHINGNKQDNRVENLRWATHSENTQYFYNEQKPNGLYNPLSDEEKTKYREYKKDYVEKNKEKLKKKQELYLNEHKEEIKIRCHERYIKTKEQRKHYYQEHKKEIIAYQKEYQKRKHKAKQYDKITAHEYYESHKEKYKEQRKCYREKHKEEIKAYQKAYREKHRAEQNNQE